MNNKLKKGITDFMNKVSEYIYLEYKPKYYREFTKDKNLANFYDFVGSYYMGGSNVPDTARYVVDLIKMRSREEKND
jgi:hypothetical protein